MRRSEDIDSERLDGLADRPAHQRLRGEMQHDLRLGLCNRLANDIVIAEIAEAGCDVGAYARAFEQVRCGLRSERKAGHAGAHPCQPQCAPGSLEARVPGEKNATAAPECRID